MLYTPVRPGGSLPERPDLDRSPLLVFYETTQACDLTCVHCRACAQTEPHPSELSTRDALALIGQLSQFPDPPMLVLTGGDPLKRRDIYSLVERAVDSGLNASITPSATPLVTYDAIRRLRDAGMLRLAISLDGADAAAHDGHRGVRGSFARTLEILADANSLGIPTQVNTTLHRGNFDQIEDIAELLTGKGIALWSVFFLVPVGRASRESRLSADECERAFDRLWRQAQIRPYAIKTTEAPHYRRYVLRQRRKSRYPERVNDACPTPRGFSQLGINDGKGVMFISHAGLIHPSGFLPIVCGVFPESNVV